MKRAGLVAVGSLVLAGAGAVAYLVWFAPEPSTAADEAFPDLGTSPSATSGTVQAPPPQALRSGSFVGADDFHFARGSVALHQAANGSYVLRFEGYDAREGPDVYLYLTKRAGDDTSAKVEGEGLRLRVPGGEADGRATVRGAFNVWLPAGTDALAYGGLTIWCDQFNHFFGHAPLT